MTPNGQGGIAWRQGFDMGEILRRSALGSVQITMSFGPVPSVIPEPSGKAAKARAARPPVVGGAHFAVGHSYWLSQPRARMSASVCARRLGAGQFVARMSRTAFSTLAAATVALPLARCGGRAVLMQRASVHPRTAASRFHGQTTLGLDRRPRRRTARDVRAAAIGAFLTTDPTLQDNSPAPTSVPAPFCHFGTNQRLAIRNSSARALGSAARPAPRVVYRRC
jgi:hypothetical protein